MARSAGRAHHDEIGFNALIDMMIYEPRIFWCAVLLVAALAWREHYAHLDRRTTFTPRHAPVHPPDRSERVGGRGRPVMSRGLEVAAATPCLQTAIGRFAEQGVFAEVLVSGAGHYR